MLIEVPDAVARPTAAVFGGLSRLRGRRAMHPVGVVLAGQLQVPDDVSLPRAWRALDGMRGIVRFSKSVGLPGQVPDVLGVALRFGEQDLLLASALRPPVLQHLLIPAAGFDRTTFSTLLPHRVGRTAAVIQGRLDSALPEADSYLDAVARSTGINLQLEAVSFAGRRRRLGVVAIGEVIESEPGSRVRFDPWRSGAGLDPVGPLQVMRAAAYAASRRAVPR